MVNRYTSEKRLARSQELGILVDPEDEWLLSAMTWCISTKGYVESTAYDGAWRKTVKIHHYLMGTPVWENQFVDHINRNKLDNRRCNLRWADGYTNRHNSDYIDNAKNIRATYNGKYELRIQRDGVLEQVGTYNTVEEAIDVRDTWHQSYINA